MSGWIMDRMVERAIPPDVEDPDQERIAEEAAENAIRHVVTIACIAGLVVFAALAALLYGFPAESANRSRGGAAVGGCITNRDGGCEAPPGQGGVGR